MTCTLVCMPGYPITPMKAGYAPDRHLASPNVGRSGWACIDEWKVGVSSMLTVGDKLLHDMIHDPSVTRYDSVANSDVVAWAQARRRRRGVPHHRAEGALGARNPAAAAPPRGGHAAPAAAPPHGEKLRRCAMTYTYTQAPPIPKHRPQEPKKYPTLSIKKVCAMIEERCGSVRITERHGRECGNYAVILPEAMQELTSIISYRRRSPMNVNEQKFGGYGHFLRNPAGGMIAVIKHFIEVPTVNRTPVSAGNLGPNGELNPALDFLEYVRAEFFRTEEAVQHRCLRLRGRPVSGAVRRVGVRDGVPHAPGSRRVLVGGRPPQRLAPRGQQAALHLRVRPGARRDALQHGAQL